MTLDLAQRLNDDEITARDRLEAAVSLPIGVLTIIGGAIVYSAAQSSTTHTSIHLAPLFSTSCSHGSLALPYTASSGLWSISYDRFMGTSTKPWHPQTSSGITCETLRGGTLVRGRTRLSLKPILMRPWQNTSSMPLRPTVPTTPFAERTYITASAVCFGHSGLRCWVAFLSW